MRFSHVATSYLGAGSCDPKGKSKKDQQITVSYGINGCQDWYEIESIR